MKQRLADVNVADVVDVVDEVSDDSVPVVVVSVEVPVGIDVVAVGFETEVVTVPVGSVVVPVVTPLDVALVCVTCDAVVETDVVVVGGVVPNRVHVR